MIHGCLPVLLLSAALAQNLQPTPLPPVYIQDAEPVERDQAQTPAPSYDWEEDITPSWQDETAPIPRYEWEDTTPPAEPPAPEPRQAPPAPPEAAPEPAREVQVQEQPEAPAPEQRPQPQRRVAAFWMIVPGQ